MRKSATLVSGILTIVLFAGLSFLSIFQLGVNMDSEVFKSLIENSNILSFILTSVTITFIKLPLVSSVTIVTDEFKEEIFNSMAKGLTIVLVVFSLYMVFWGIKEICISQKSDEKFARCKKTCGFMMFTKFMFFLFLAISIVSYFTSDVNKGAFGELISEFTLTEKIKLEYSVLEYIVIGSLAGLTVYAFVIFILPAINFLNAYKLYNSGNNQPNGEQNFQDDQNINYNNQNDQAYTPQPTMQANMPPVPGFQPQYNVQPQQVVQPQPIFATSEPQPSVQAQFNPQIQAEEALRASSVTPGQNGVPINITQKGIEGLERLERLRASGMLTEANYQAMRLKE